MLNSIFLATLFKWLTRRGLELGGLLTLVASADPTVLQNTADTLGAILTGQWQDVNLGSVAALVSVVGGLIWNARSTFGAHATVGGVQVPVSQMTPAKKAEVKEAVAVTAAKKRPNILDTIFKR